VFTFPADEEVTWSGVVVEVGTASGVEEGCGDDDGDSLVGVGVDEVGGVGGVEDGVGVVLGGSGDELGGGVETRKENKEWSAVARENQQIEDQI
jgi:hypothetical protein